MRPKERHNLAIAAAGLAVTMLLLAISMAGGGKASTTIRAESTKTVPPPDYVYLPLVARHLSAYTCPVTSTNLYISGRVHQIDTDDPVRPAHNHADKNLSLRGYTPNTDPNLQRELVSYGTEGVDDTQPPQFATLFMPYRVPDLSGFYQVYDWNWATSPEPGTRGDPLAGFPVTALGLETTAGEVLCVPKSGYDIGVVVVPMGFQVMVLYADEDTIALRYTSDDSSATNGYTVHIDNICTDPNLLTLYNALDDPDGPRYVYKSLEERPYLYDLPGLYAGQPFGTARGTEIVVAIADTGSFMDPRSCAEWWQIQPGYEGGCPPAVLGGR